MLSLSFGPDCTGKVIPPSGSRERKQLMARPGCHREERAMERARWLQTTGYRMKYRAGARPEGMRVQLLSKYYTLPLEVSVSCKRREQEVGDTGEKLLFPFYFCLKMFYFFFSEQQC